MFKRFWQNEEGNIAMIVAMMLVPMVGTIGAGVDFMRAVSLRGELQASVDSGALAAANLQSTGDIATIVDQYVDSNLARHTDFLATVTVTVEEEVAINSKTVDVTASGHIDTYFLGLLGIETLDVTASTSATESMQNVEISLVLDISSSMRGSKLTNLKTAASNFVTQMLDDDSRDVTSISLIPFGGTVNIGEDMFDEFAANPLTSNVNPSESDYDIGSNVTSSHFLFPGHGDYCIEYPSDAFSGDMLRTNDYGQVPHFWKWNRFNPWCPLDSSAAIFNTNDVDVLTTQIDGMTMSDGTGMDIGTMWGLKALSPDWKGELGGDFSERPAAYNDETLKIMIVMTDGGITPQYRPEDYRRYSTHTNRDEGTVATGNGSGNQGNNNNQQTIVSNGNASTPAEQNKAVGYFKRSCDEAQSSGAVIYTIGFKINANSLPDQMLKYCATDLSKYYHVESLDIESAFNSIAASVNALRITE